MSEYLKPLWGGLELAMASATAVNKKTDCTAVATAR